MCTTLYTVLYTKVGPAWTQFQHAKSMNMSERHQTTGRGHTTQWLLTLSHHNNEPQSTGSGWIGPSGDDYKHIGENRSWTHSKRTRAPASPPCLPFSFGRSMRASSMHTTTNTHPAATHNLSTRSLRLVQRRPHSSPLSAHKRGARSAALLSSKRRGTILKSRDHTAH